jgi:hypothetical protein
VFYELKRELAETVHSIGADSYVEQIILRDLQIQTDELRFKAALESPLTVKSSTGDETIVGPSLFQALLDLETIQVRHMKSILIWHASFPFPIVISAKGASILGWKAD